MSLVNQMLNGLESRQELLSGSHDSVFDDLCAVSEEELHSNAGDGLHRGTALFLAALLGIFAVSLLSTSQSLQQVASGKAPAAIRNHHAASMSADGMNDVTAAQQFPVRGGNVALRLDAGKIFMSASGQQNAVRSAGIVIKKINLKSSGAHLNIEMGLPGKTKYLIYTLDDPDRVVLELNNSRYNGPLPDINSMEAVRAVRQRVGQDGTYRLVVETGNPVRIDSAGIEKAQSGYALKVDVALAEAGSGAPASKPVDPAAAVSRAGTMEISPVAADGVEKLRVADDDVIRVDRMVFEARKLYEEGEIDKGLNKLLNAVKLAPGNVGARATLAVLLYEQGQGKMADYILHKGLRKHPHQPEWTKILARALYSEGKVDKALELLEAAPPPVKGHLEYHALYAGILQEKGKYKRAALVYRNLLKQQSSNGAWWMGLAISLEAMSRKNDAIIAYRNALNTPQLTPESSRFVKDRLNRLNQKS